MIFMAPMVKKLRQKFDLSSQLPSHTEQDNKKIVLDQLFNDEWLFLRVQGRTVLLENTAGIIRAVKIQKLGEATNELGKEYTTTAWLGEHASEVDLKSQYPQSLYTGTVSNIAIHRWLKKMIPANQYANFKQLISTDKNKEVYIYQVEPRTCNYFTYLHDPSLSDEQFQTANHNIVHDLYTLLKAGMAFPQLADIFHNLEHRSKRADRGRYMVLVNILRNFNFQGSGRITGWSKAVEYPNVRASGLADLGDYVPVNDFISDGFMAKRFFSEARTLYGERSGNFILANLMAEYQYVLFLNAGRRGRDLTIRAKKEKWKNNDIDAIWYRLAQQMMDNCVQAVVLLTNQNEQAITKILNALVDVERLGRQMKYWMTTDYVPYLKKNKIKDGIYEPGTVIEVNINHFRAGSFHNKIGFCLNEPDQDLGPVNGQEPIKEANKLLYWMVTKVFEAYNLLHLTVKHLNKVTNEKDVFRSESLRTTLFGHLPKKQYHKLQHTLCEERLKQTGLPISLKEPLTVEAQSHKRAYAASTIQTFWRNYDKTEKKDTSAPRPR